MPAKEYKIAGHYIVQGDFYALGRLGTGAGRHLYLELVEDIAGEAGAIETGSWRTACITVAEAGKILGISRHIVAELHHFGVSRPVDRCGVDTFKRRRSECCEEEE